MCLVYLSDMWCQIVDESEEDQHYGYMQMTCVPSMNTMGKNLFFFLNKLF